MSRIVLISAVAEGYRRGGLKFGKEPIKVDLDDLEDGPAVAIETDPNLTIKPLEISADCSKCQEQVAALMDENSKLKGQLSAAHADIDRLNQFIAEMAEANKPTEQAELVTEKAFDNPEPASTTKRGAK